MRLPGVPMVQGVFLYSLALESRAKFVVLYTGGAIIELI
jgi:hypothetical protein